MMSKIKFLLTFLCLIGLYANAAYLTNVPRTLVQPNGDTLHCYISGDEFYCRLHDANGYTIVQNPHTGYFVYAIEDKGKIVPSDFVAGTCNPAVKGLRPNIKISNAEYAARRKAMLQPAKRPVVRDENTNKGDFNNLVVFISFADDSMFTNTFSSINDMFNDSTDNYKANSLFDFFKHTSYNQLFIHTSFYPEPEDEQIISYQDSLPRAYYMPWSELNPIGYIANDSIDERIEREQNLLARAVLYIQDMVPSTLNIDYNNDGYVDNICFVVKGDVGDWNVLLWPHQWALYTQDVYINGKRVFDFNFQLADAGGYFNTSVMCHEMFHSLGAPDLYHYDDDTNMDAIGSWDLMCSNQEPPQQTCAYMKYKYGNWISEDDIIELNTYGTYTINALNSAESKKICYRIPTDDPLEFILMDYRNQNEPFDSQIPGRGIIFYRINALYNGNADYDGIDVFDEIYIFRKNGTLHSNGSLNQANFREDIAARNKFTPTSNPYPFLTYGEPVILHIGNFESALDSMHFDYMEWVGIENFDTESYAVQPNPAHQQITFSAPNNDEKTLQLYNIFGQFLTEFQTSSTQLSWDISPYPAGCYFIKIFENQKFVKTLKFIKQ
ncbi:MAG: M6 family metalloprotease domain-containing protein [Bacteroidales bacterium]|nr:M6 family metalloprotease domain-containing protein [Bacteroidales bacterium]